MEWLEILKGPLAASPVAAVLGFGCWTLWKELKEVRAELKQSHADRLQDLKQIAKLDD